MSQINIAILDMDNVGSMHIKQADVILRVEQPFELKNKHL